MNRHEPAPPQWAEAALRALVRPADRETISGDLLEEFRASKYPARGPFGASIWYLKQVFSMLWRLIRPCALTLVVLQVGFGVLVSHHAFEANSVAFVLLKSLWYGSPVQAPGISLFDAAMYGWAAYRAARHSTLWRTGILAGAATSVVGLAALFTALAIVTPQLLLAVFTKPFIFVILAVMLCWAAAYGILFGILGGGIGRWVAAAFPLERPVA